MFHANNDDACVNKFLGRNLVGNKIRTDVLKLTSLLTYWLTLPLLFDVVSCDVMEFFDMSGPVYSQTARLRHLKQHLFRAKNPLHKQTIIIIIY